MSMYVAFFRSIPLGNAISLKILLVFKHFVNNKILTLDSYLSSPSQEMLQQEAKLNKEINKL
jgi:hypothetical protein